MRRLKIVDAGKVFNLFNAASDCSTSTPLTRGAVESCRRISEVTRLESVGGYIFVERGIV